MNSASCESTRKTILAIGNNFAAREENMLKTVERQTPYRVMYATTEKQLRSCMEQGKPEVILFAQQNGRVERDKSIEVLKRSIETDIAFKHTPKLILGNSEKKPVSEKGNILCLSQPFQTQHLIAALDTLIVFPEGCVQV